MLKETENAAKASAAHGAPDRMAAARAGRKPRDPNGVVLSPRSRYALNILLQASKGCKMLAQSLRAGNDIDPEVLRAANTLASEAANEMFRD